MIYIIDFCGFPWCILPWLLSGFLGFLMGYFWMNKWKSMYNDMEAKYNGLTKKHADLESEYAACKSARATLEGDLSTAQGVTKEAQASLAQTQADLEACRKEKAAMPKASADISSAASGFAAGAVASNLTPEEPKVEEKPAPSKPSGPYAGLKSDNLQIIEGIGPKMESVLHAAGVKSWSDLASKSHEELRGILDSHGDKYKIINPSTWAEQASFAAKGDWDGLIVLQKEIDGAAGTNSKGSDSKLEKLIGKTQKAGFSKYKENDLKIVEGVGPKIAGLLNDAGIKTWAGLANTQISKIQEILDNAGPRYKLANPGSWPQQAGLAAAGKWDELRKLQDELDGGK